MLFFTHPRDNPVKADTAEEVEGERTVSQDGSHAQSRVRAPFGDALRWQKRPRSARSSPPAQARDARDASGATAAARLSRPRRACPGRRATGCTGRTAARLTPLAVLTIMHAPACGTRASAGSAPSARQCWARRCSCKHGQGVLHATLAQQGACVGSVRAEGDAEARYFAALCGCCAHTTERVSPVRPSRTGGPPRHGSRPPRPASSTRSPRWPRRV